MLLDDDGDPLKNTISHLCYYISSNTFFCMSKFKFFGALLIIKESRPRGALLEIEIFHLKMD